MTLDELAQDMAERYDVLLREIASLRERIAALEGAEAAEVEPTAAPVVHVAAPNVTVAAPRVDVAAPSVTLNVPPPPDCVVTHEWGMDKGHFVPVRSFVTRRN